MGLWPYIQKWREYFPLLILLNRAILIWKYANQDGRLIFARLLSETSIWIYLVFPGFIYAVLVGNGCFKTIREDLIDVVSKDFPCDTNVTFLARCICFFLTRGTRMAAITDLFY